MRRRAAFTLVELLIVISVIGVLMSILMPVLGRARSLARLTKCSGQLHQLGAGWQMYADGNLGYCMPQVWFQASPWIYWWGTYENPPDYTRGLLAPYVAATAGADGLFDCPEQPWGSYIPEGTGTNPTTTSRLQRPLFLPAPQRMGRQRDEGEGPLADD